VLHRPGGGLKTLSAVTESSQNIHTTNFSGLLTLERFGKPSPAGCSQSNTREANFLKLSGRRAWCGRVRAANRPLLCRKIAVRYVKANSVAHRFLGIDGDYRKGRTRFAARLPPFDVNYPGSARANRIIGPYGDTAGRARHWPRPPLTRAMRSMAPAQWWSRASQKHR